MLADRPSRNLHVLFADGADGVAGREVSGSELVRIEPYAHGVIAGAEDFHIAGARDASQHVFDLQSGVVAEIDLVVAAVRREKVNDHGEVGRLLGGGDTQTTHFLRQLGQRLRHAILHLDLRFINVRAEFEGHRQRHYAVARSLGKHIERVLDTVNGLL